MKKATSTRLTRKRAKAEAEQRGEGELEDSQTPEALKSSTVLNRLKIVKKNKFSERKFFTVVSDWTILKYWRENRSEVSTREIADNLSEEIDHSSESIRDRIKRYISKLKKIDEVLIEEEAKVSSWG
jgi:hypothetical protein